MRDDLRLGREDRVDRGEELGQTSTAPAELAAAQRRINELETEPSPSTAGRQSNEGEHRPKSRFAAIKVMSAEDLPIQVGCRVLGVSESGFNA